MRVKLHGSRPKKNSQRKINRAHHLPVSGDDDDDDHSIEYYSVNYYFPLNLYSVYFDC